MKTEFSVRLKMLRLKAGIYQKDLAWELNVVQSLIAHWENGNNQPDINKLIEISYFFNVSTDYLLGKTDIPKSADYDAYSQKELSVLKELKGLPSDEINVIRGIIYEYRRNRSI